MDRQDRQTDKTTRWAFTAYEAQWDLFKTMPECIAEWGWQTEKCPDTERLHYQGFLRTKRQVRFSQMKKDFPGVHIEVAKNWQALMNYCKKSESAVSGTQVHESARAYLKFSDALTKLGAAYICADGQLPDDAFADAVRTLAFAQPEDISLYTNPQIKRAWDLTQIVWIQRAYHLHADGCQLSANVCGWCQQADANASANANEQSDVCHEFIFLDESIADGQGSEGSEAREWQGKERSPAASSDFGCEGSGRSDCDAEHFSGCS